MYKYILLFYKIVTKEEIIEGIFLTELQKTRSLYMQNFIEHHSHSKILFAFPGETKFLIRVPYDWLRMRNQNFLHYRNYFIATTLAEVKYCCSQKFFLFFWKQTNKAISLTY